MKNAVTVLMIFIIKLSTPTIIFAQTPAVESHEVLSLSGNIMDGAGNMSGVLVELFQGNKLMSSFETTRKGQYEFDLSSGHIYTIQLSKEGFYTRRISVNTKIPAGYASVHELAMDFHMDAMDSEKFDHHLIDYPSVLIAFDQSSSAFGFDKAYTSSYFNELESSQR